MEQPFYCALRCTARRSLNVIAFAALAIFAVAPHEARAAEGSALAAGRLQKAEETVVVDNAWIRPTVQGQTATGGYMTLTALKDLALTGLSTPAAKTAELHEMVMEGSIMRMRAISSLSLPAGKPVVMRPGPGGHHLMLMDLKQALKEGDEVTLTLQLRTPAGKALKQVVKVPVRRVAPVHDAQPSTPSHPHHDHHGEGKPHDHRH